MKNRTLKLFVVVLNVLFIFSCTTTPIVTVPALTTTSITNITGTTASGGGTITSDGGGSIIARGVCWSTSANPTTADSKTTDGIGTGSFTSSLTALTTTTQYHVRAYATNSAGTTYGNDISFSTSFVCGVSTVTDIDGNVYNTVTIGTQCWMAENLKTSKYKDGVAIPTGLSNTDWQNATTGAYVIYNDDAANNTTYGKLYNWYAVNTGKLAPAGWHVPTDAEWTTLTTFLGGESVAGDKMKSTSSLWTPYTGIVNTNSSGFSGLPGGYRNYDGTYYTIGDAGTWWSSTEYDTTSAWGRYLSYIGSSAYRYGPSKAGGFSVRCVKD